MKIKIALLTTTVGLVASPVFAQSSVTLYGIIDEGVTYTLNQHGANNFQMQSGVTQGSRWGLRGKEDLGGGLSTIFVLENGFDPSSGALGQNGRLFGRQAYVGLDSHVGAVTLGRQYEFMADFMVPATAFGQWGIYFAHAGDVDNLSATGRINNAVKYVSPSLGGVKLGALYSFGGQPGAFSKQSVVSLGASYSGGPLYAAAAYTHINSPYAAVYDSTPKSILFTQYLTAAQSESIYGIGASYTWGPVTGGLDATRTTFDSGFKGGNVDFDNYEGWLTWLVTPAVRLGGAYTLTTVDVHAASTSPRYQQYGLVADYLLSKRTDVYVMGLHMAGSANTQAQINMISAASSNPRQSVVRVGLRHRF